ncbi:MAG: hypothetical protein DSZ05_06095, partial [Sulfurospirillum sp.]
MTKKALISFIVATLLLQGCGGGGSTGSSSSSSSSSSGGTSSDTQKPHITLKGNKTLIIEKGQPFTDPGATALDDKDGDITSKITKEPASIDTSVPGEYEIVYRVSDKAG